jgi:hypothetical protein
MKCIRLHYIDACLRIASTLSESSQGELKYLIQYLTQQKQSFPSVSVIRDESENLGSFRSRDASPAFI